MVNLWLTKTHSVMVSYSNIAVSSSSPILVESREKLKDLSGDEINRRILYQLIIQNEIAGLQLKKQREISNHLLFYTILMVLGVVGALATFF